VAAGRLDREKKGTPSITLDAQMFVIIAAGTSPLIGEKLDAGHPA